jgi:two-component system, cell cycle response regulator
MLDAQVRYRSYQNRFVREAVSKMKDAPKHILIAEDDLTSRTMLAAVLRKWGYAVVETVNGAEAWAALQEPGAPGLVILDWMMPVMDGLAVVQRVRAMPADHPTPYIIMLTTRGEKVDIIAGLDAGANDYLAKPFDVGELRARVEVGRRMVEMRQALIENREALAFQATHDALTGLLNRRAILDQLHKELERAGRHGDGLVVGAIDIDHFKKINDTYGHQTGDDVLCGFARVLSDQLREYDTAGRIGGEEFLVIAPIKAGRRPVSVFDRLCGKIAASRIPTRAGALQLTVSIGVTVASAGSAVDDILGKADAALYEAKAQGRNRAVYAGDRDPA